MGTAIAQSMEVDIKKGAVSLGYFAVPWPNQYLRWSYCLLEKGTNERKWKYMWLSPCYFDTPCDSMLRTTSSFHKKFEIYFYFKTYWTREWTACRAVIELVRSSAIRPGSGDGGDGGRAVFVVELDPIYMWCHSPHDSLSRFPQWQGSSSQNEENMDLEKEPGDPNMRCHRPHDNHHSLSRFPQWQVFFF